MSKIVVVDGPLRGKTFEVTELASIGRGDACAVRLDGRHVSRLHARLERRDAGMLIRDNDSRNGIFVNGLSVKEAILRPDDLLELGEHVLVFDPTADPQALPRARAVETLADPFAPADPDERLGRALGAAAALAAMDSEKEIAQALLDALTTALSAERAFVMVADAGGPLRPLARRVPLGEEEFALSGVLQHLVMQERRSILAVDIRRRPPAAGARVGVLAVPLAAKTTAVGLAYLETKLADREDRPRQTTADLRLAAVLAAFAGQRLLQLQRLWTGARLGHKSLPDFVSAFEKEAIVEALHVCKGDLDAAARGLGISRQALDARLKALGLVAGPAQPPPPPPPPPAAWKSVEI
ncbi:MAG TPA: FHA domain-containing protein [Planctomycetota bacterium]|nr:FHA domain-containing protein [Planctomycetota bacterium]